jgi:hypothetical protein
MAALSASVIPPGGIFAPSHRIRTRPWCGRPARKTEPCCRRVLVRSKRDEGGSTSTASSIDARSDGESARVLTATLAGKIVWALLLLLGALFLFAVASDLAADAGVGLPSDHRGTFAQLAGMTWTSAKARAHGTASYITLLEVAYAFHELVFAILYLVIVAIPFRRGFRWAWWACWAVEIANIVYVLTFGRHDSTILARALVAAIALPVLLLAAAPWFFGNRRAPNAV